ncbi:MAG: SDR family NAD(P)-dependent oxidoreductase [Solirubrobacteraceae bacterium]|nr:SDR family NAD(P)-dependent oxidoreductase [Solirubrobacteraceae bacterium]
MNEPENTTPDDAEGPSIDQYVDEISGEQVDPEGDYETRIDPEALATALAVLAQLDTLPVDHPDAVQVRIATNGIWKSLKKRRKRLRRDEVVNHDAAVTASTATAAPGRIDDETAGILLKPTAHGIVGTLKQARPCYICKERYTEVDAFYHQLCPTCAAFNWSRREAGADLTGRRALLTGGRAKIGMYIALRLLRDGAHTTITTRFPADALRRFKAMPDSETWLHRLKVVGIDLRDPRQVIALADDVAAAGPLDILINNAAQTVRRTSGSYSQLIAGEMADPTALTEGGSEVLVLGQPHDAHPLSITGLASPHLEAGDAIAAAEEMTALAMTAGSSSLERTAAGTAIDAGGLMPDIVDSNSWSEVVDQIDPIELLEVQLCNSTAPFLLVSRLRASMASSPAHRKYVVNVSAMEGQFSRGYKGPGHPHTNMAKAALNMLTRTSANEMFETDRILMTAVDTGWITDERPHTTKARLHEEGFAAPLDLVDGAARVYDPIVRGEAGEDLMGIFLKDFKKHPW